MNEKQLKDSILQYAIQGKLVSQDPNDGLASELMKRISLEKERLIKEKVIKREKPLSPITEEEKPFDVPDSWEWVRLNEISIYIQRGKSPKYSLIEEIPVISQKCVQWTGFTIEPAKFIEPSTLEKYEEIRLLQSNDILWNSTGLGTIGRVGIYDSNLNPYPIAVADSHVTVLRASKMVNIKYLYYFLASPTIQNSISDIAAGSTKQKELNTSTIKSIVVPLPPLREQERIVEKIERLLNKVEVYNDIFTEVNNLNKEFPMHLEKSILYYAMQGKLIDQNPNDESAHQLLEKIQLQKKQMINDKVIKKEKPLILIAEEEKPFAIPNSWRWVRLGDIIQFLSGYAYKSSAYVSNSDFQIIRLGNVKKNKLLLEVKPIFINKELAKQTEAFLVKENDILVTMTGTKGKKDYFYTCLVNDSDLKNKNLYLNQRVGCIRPLIDGISKFLIYLLQSPLILDRVFEKETGTANQGNLGIEAIKNLLIPLPPLEEQKRIVRAIENVLSSTEKFNEINKSN